MKVAITSYTGEYGAALHKAILDQNCWVRELDRANFEDGFFAGGGKPEDLDAAWVKYLHEQIFQGFATTSELDSVSMMLVLSPTEEQLVAITMAFADVLKADAVGQYCGDDQHYDYFPDAMEMLLQLCRAWEDQGGLTLYQTVRNFAWNSHWKADEEYPNIDAWLPAK